MNPGSFRKPREGDQPTPAPNDRPPSWGLVIDRVMRRRSSCPEASVKDHDDLIELMILRDQLGAVRYGTRLQSHNGRDAMRDALEEALDLRVYLENLRLENPGSAESGMIADEVTDLCLRLVALRRKLREKGGP